MNGVAKLVFDVVKVLVYSGNVRLVKVKAYLTV